MKLVFVVVVSTMFVFTACEKKDDSSIDSVIGTYIGTLTPQNGIKSLTKVANVDDSAIADVTLLSEGLIEVHCYGDELDTTFMLNYYDHNDSLMVCLSGDDFENTYGHMLGEGHMGGGMMGDIQDGESNWEHHMNDEHQDGEDHFGGFDLMGETFTYSFMMNDSSNSNYLKFQGMKESK